MATGHCKTGDPDIMVISDPGDEPTRLHWLLGDLPVQVTGRLGTNSVLRLPPPRRPGQAPGQTARPASGRLPCCLSAAGRLLGLLGKAAGLHAGG